MYKEIIDNIKPEFEKLISYFSSELVKIRASRPSVSLVENLNIDCFGQNFPLKQLGTITISNPREITIKPWDESYLEPIQAAILRSSLSAGVIIEKNIIRVSFPGLSEERRRDLVMLLSQKAEEAKRTVRHWRQEAWKQIQDGARSSQIREDDKFRAKDELQDLVDETNKKIDQMRESKEKDIIN